MIQEISSISLREIKAWFKFSETILLSRIDVLVGFVIAAVAAMDWSPLMTLDFSSGFDKKQLYVIGGFCVLRGVVGEIARRRNAKFEE